VKGKTVREIFLIFALFAASSCLAQQPPPSSIPPRTDSPNEIDKLKESCFNVRGLLGCAEELFTGKPVHIAVGSIAPQNGFGAGIAYLGHHTTDNWRNSWNADAIGSINGSWRAGFYMKFVHTPESGIGVGFGTPPPVNSNLSELPEHTVFGLYAQAISLNKLLFFGEGSATTLADRSFFGMTETIVGGNFVKPFYERLHASFYGQINGRFVNIRGSHSQSGPSIEQLYTEATAPGLTSQPGTVQFEEGLRVRPILAKDVVRLNYSVAYQQYVALGNGHFTFERLMLDLGHEFALYGTTTRILEPRLANGPDDCAIDPVSHPECPKISVRNFEGSVGLRFVTALSMMPAGNVVPFYFQPTLGGSDINGNPSLASYQDYRFRAPNVLLLRESFEHSIWKWPVGFTFLADQGKAAISRGDLGSSRWLHSFSTGLTLRAGGFPQIYLLFSWSGGEGTHTIANVNTSLLGGGARPSLF
jgi:hypothetical protein